MKCPLCCESLKDVIDDPDEVTRGYCCACGIMVAVYEMPSQDEVCLDHEDDELSELKKMVEEEDEE